MSLTLRFFKERPELLVATRLAAQFNWMEKPAQLLRTDNKRQRWQAAGEGVATEAVAAGSAGFARLMILERPGRCGANRSSEPEEKNKLGEASDCRVRRSGRRSAPDHP